MYSLLLRLKSAFERREELSRIFLQTVELTKEECDILKLCITEEHEAIGIIGCLLNDKSKINNARLVIASLNQSSKELANKAEELLNLSESEYESLIDDLCDDFLSNTDELTEYEDKILSILFGILSSRT